MIPPVSELITLCHLTLSSSCKEGDIVLDATAGNGHDTLFLASLVGKEGLVVAVDIQEEALQAARTLLHEKGRDDIVRLLQGDHADLCDLLKREIPAGRELSAAVFNLGFLPGSDKRVRTSAASTVRALNEVWPHLRAGGLLSVHTYSGHEGAEEESAAVDAWMRGLGWNMARVTSCRQHNKPSRCETLYLARKVGLSSL